MSNASDSRAHRIHHLTVPSDAQGERLDRWLAEQMDTSRTQVARWVEEGRVTWRGGTPRKSEPLSEGDEVQVEVPAPVPLRAEPQDLPIEIVYQDAHLLVVNKPPGMVVHPAPGHPSGTLVNALLHHVKDLAGIGGALRPGIVHRLDRDTSGLLVVAKDDATHQALSAALKKRAVRRIYLAASWGHLLESPMTIDAPLARSPRDRKRMAVVEEGRRAVTHLRVLERWPSAELLELSLDTGRTHQIRVHLAHVGHPVVGDAVYGEGWVRGMGGPNRRWAEELDRRTPRQFLHAWRLAFRHPVTGEVLRWEAPLPPDLDAVVQWAHGESR
jgi:23S rRNA pseudouridine1911/1915/1917 synthase